MRHRHRLTRRRVRTVAEPPHSPGPVAIPSLAIAPAPFVAPAPQSFPTIPRTLDRAIRTTAAALPKLGDDPATHLGAVIDMFEHFNPQTITETLAVSRFLLAGAAAEGLQRRAIDPALPAVLAERLTRTALAALRIQERLLRLLAQASEADAMRAAPLPGVWAQWREDLLRREEYERAAAEARAADREATVAAEAARVAADAGAAQPGDVTASTETQPCRRDSLQSGKPEPARAEPECWGGNEPPEEADFVRPQHRLADVLGAEAAIDPARAQAA